MYAFLLLVAALLFALVTIAIVVVIRVKGKK